MIANVMPFSNVSTPYFNLGEQSGYDEHRAQDSVQKNDSKQELIDLNKLDVEDSIGLYLQEIGKVPLLSAKEEVVLGKRIEAGKQAKKQLDLGVTDTVQRNKLLHSLKDGRMAAEHLTNANSRLVVSIAKKYIGRGVPLQDLIQEGNLGLMRAVQKFDYHRGYKFSTYATWWIRQSVTRALADQGRTIRVPVHMHEQIVRHARSRQDLNQTLGRDPTIEEIAEELNISVEKVESVLHADRQLMSLDQPVGERENTSLGELIEDSTTLAVDEIAEQNILSEAIAEALQSLSAREAGILRMRFGLNNGRHYTLEEIGKKYGVTRERIRQIEARALVRLRHPSRSRPIREYSENV